MFIFFRRNSRSSARK